MMLQNHILHNTISSICSSGLGFILMGSAIELNNEHTLFICHRRQSSTVEFYKWKKNNKEFIFFQMAWINLSEWFVFFYEAYRSMFETRHMAAISKNLYKLRSNTLHVVFINCWFFAIAILFSTYFWKKQKIHIKSNIFECICCCQ